MCTSCKNGVKRPTIVVNNTDNGMKKNESIDCEDNETKEKDLIIETNSKSIDNEVLNVDDVESVTGIPDYLGFIKIAEVPATQTKYTDTNGGKGLAVGARYCYRLLAVYPVPGGGESYVSRDTCLAPILADAPVVTNVTVDKTSPTAGKITVK